MKIFVVRVNPDTRPGLSYSAYPSESEYNKIRVTSPMKGFEEAVNFLDEGGLVRGYLPPKHLRSMRSAEPFALITITAKTSKTGGDMVVGIQVGCIYVGENKRVKPATAPKFRALDWHYTCASSDSFLFNEPVSGARGLVLGNKGSWLWGPTKELKPSEFKSFTKAVETLISNKDDRKRFRHALKLTKQDVKLSAEDSSLAHMGDAGPSGVEGKKKLVKHLIRERKLYLAKAKKEDVFQKTRKLACEACRFDFAKKFGVAGKMVCEVHHRKALSGGLERNTSLEDLAILCANCHRMIHRTDPMMSVEDFIKTFGLSG